MHGIIGQLADDPLRLGILLLFVVALIAIARCLTNIANLRGGGDR